MLDYRFRLYALFRRTGKLRPSLPHAFTVTGRYALRGSFLFFGIAVLPGDEFFGSSSSSIEWDHVISSLSLSGGVTGQGGRSKPTAFGGVLCLDGGLSSSATFRMGNFSFSYKSLSNE
jgi:hypothetical protein